MEINEVPVNDEVLPGPVVRGPGLGKDMTLKDLEQIIRNLRLELNDYKQSEAEAYAIFNEFMLVAQRLKSGIYRYDIKSHRFLFFNRAMIRMLGSEDSKASDITSKSIKMRIHPSDREAVRQAARQSQVSGNDCAEVEYRFKTSQGDYRWHYDRWVVLRDPSGQPLYLEGILIDITERKIAEEMLLESQNKLRQLSSHLLETQEKMWRRIALELHDELGQTLSMLKLQLRSIQKASKVQDSHKILAECEDADAYIDRIIENVRRLSQELCPSCLEDLGLDESIVMLAEDFSKYAHLKIDLSATKIDRFFTHKSRIMIYRLVQEALNNVQKHAQAKRVSIEISKKSTLVEIQIEDDGCGFLTPSQCTMDKCKSGMGLTAMEVRSRMLNGQMKVVSQIGIGTKIVFVIPIFEGVQCIDNIAYSVG